MNVSDLLNPLPNEYFTNEGTSYMSQYSFQPNTKREEYYLNTKVILSPGSESMISKPRSRFSNYEDNIILEGVAKRLTWGQISDLLPHRKRATCFNRYRTLQGIRKSRKHSSSYTTPPTSPSINQSPLYYHRSFFNHNQPYQKSISSYSNDSDTSSISEDLEEFNMPINPSHKLSLPSFYYHSI